MEGRKVKKFLVTWTLSIIILLSFPSVVNAGDPVVDVTIVGPSPEVTVNTGPDSTVSVNGDGLATATALKFATSGLSYDDTWLRKYIPTVEERIKTQRGEIDLLTNALAKDIAFDQEQDRAIRELINKILQERRLTDESITALSEHISGLDDTTGYLTIQNSDLAELLNQLTDEFYSAVRGYEALAYRVRILTMALTTLASILLASAAFLIIRRVRGGV